MSDSQALGSLAADLRQRNSEELEALLVGRPDLVAGACPDINTLARRCADLYSLQAAVCALDTSHLGALTAAVLCAPPVSTDSISATLGRDCRQLAHRLWELALLWGSPQQWRFLNLLSSVVLNPYTGPAVGLIYPQVARYAAEPTAVAEALSDAPTTALRVLRDLLHNPMTAMPRPNSPGHARSGLLWLLERQIVVPVGADQVAIPAELVVILKAAGRSRPQIVQLDPPCRGWHVQQNNVDEVGAQSAMAAVELAAAICQLWATQPAHTVANGGLAVRDLKRTSAALAAPLEQVRLLILAASSAGLIGVAKSEKPNEREILAPTAEYDTWVRQNSAVRWAILAGGWAQMRYRTYRMRGERQVPHALSPESGDRRVAQWRRLVLELCTEPRYGPEETDMPGSAVGRDLSDVLDMVSWRQPGGFSEERADAVSAILTEATSLGVMAQGAMTTAGTTLVASSGHASTYAELATQAGPAAVALQPWLAPQVDSIILQSDLTIVVPGPAQGELSAFLDAIAEVESRGVARTLRVTADSLRQAMAAGWTEDAISKAFQRWSATAVPQPLQVLISDIAASYDQLRSGRASCYLRSEDQALLAQILADQKLSEYGFFQLAPTVLACRSDHKAMMVGLAKNGYRPVVESPDGDVLVSGAAPRTVKPLRHPSGWGAPPSRRRLHQVAAALAKSRLAANEGLPRPERYLDPSPVDVTDLEVIQMVIREALVTGQPLRIAHVRNDGGVGTSKVIPTSLVAGTLHAVVAQEADTAEAGLSASSAEAKVVPEIAVPLLRILHASPSTAESD